MGAYGLPATIPSGYTPAFPGASHPTTPSVVVIWHSQKFDLRPRSNKSGHDYQVVIIVDKLSEQVVNKSSQINKGEYSDGSWALGFRNINHMAFGDICRLM